MGPRRSLCHSSRALLTPKNFIWAAGLMRFESQSLCSLLTCSPSPSRSLSRKMTVGTQVTAQLGLLLPMTFIPLIPVTFYSASLYCSQLSRPPPPRPRSQISSRDDKSVVELIFLLLWCLDLLQPTVVHFSYWWSNQAAAQFVWVIIFSFISQCHAMPAFSYLFSKAVKCFPLKYPLGQSWQLIIP